MKVHHRVIDGVKVSAYNDSGTEWVVIAGDMTEQRFKKSIWTLRDAMRFAAKIAVTA